jgi:hypothetical protein
VGASADVYSLGLVLRELLTGQAPATPDPTLPLPRAIRGLLDGRLALRDVPRRRQENVPRALDAIVARCLSYEPGHRYPHALALADDLERFLAHQPLRYASNPSGRERVANWTVRNRRYVAAGMLLLAAIVGVCWESLSAAVVPIHRRAAFLHAVDKVDAGEQHQALPPLEQLERHYSHSPLLQFYLTVALQKEGNDKEARHKFATMLQALKSGPAETEFVEWGKTHPCVADQLEDFARILSKIEEARLLRDVYRLALQIDPTRKVARQKYAEVLDFEKRYMHAHDLLSGLISEFERRNAPAEKDVLASLFGLRAGVNVHWVEDVQGLQPSEVFELVRPRLKEAFADLEQQERLFNRYDRECVFDRNLVRVQFYTVQAVVDSLDGRAEASRDHFARAAQILRDELQPTGKEQVVKVEVASRKLDTWQKAMKDLSTAKRSSGNRSSAVVAN